MSRSILRAMLLLPPPPWPLVLQSQEDLRCTQSNGINIAHKTAGTSITAHELLFSYTRIGDVLRRSCCIDLQNSFDHECSFSYVHGTDIITIVITHLRLIRIRPEFIVCHILYD